MAYPQVASSVATVIGPPDSDGSFFVRETHTLTDGTTRVFDVPHYPAGTDYNAILTARAAALNAQLAIVPSPVTAGQARRAIYAAGLRSAVEAAVAGADTATQQLWYDTDIVERDNPQIIALGAGLGLTSDQLDDLFRAAAVL